MQDAEPLADLAAQTGISLRTPYKWLARYRAGGRSIPRNWSKRWSSAISAAP